MGRVLGQCTHGRAPDQGALQVALRLSDQRNFRDDGNCAAGGMQTTLIKFFGWHDANSSFQVWPSKFRRVRRISYSGPNNNCTEGTSGSTPV